MQTFKERKALRADYYNRFVHGWKLRNCTACNGSGHYDSNGSQRCGCCDGTGKERYKPEAPKMPNAEVTGLGRNRSNDD